MSGLMRESLWKAVEASTVPILLNMASLSEGSRLCTNVSMQLSVSFAVSGMFKYQAGLVNRSLKHTHYKHNNSKLSDAAPP